MKAARKTNKLIAGKILALFMSVNVCKQSFRFTKRDLRIKAQTDEKTGVKLKWDKSGVM